MHKTCGEVLSNKNVTATILRSKLPLNQRIKNRYVLRLIQWQNLKRKIVAVTFLWHRLFLGTNRKFQSRLTLSAYNSASKALNLKKYHIFGIPRTSAFTWYPPRYMMQHQNFEKLTKYKKRQNFVNFHCRPPQFMSEAAARTILTLRTLDIAHFEAETHSFSGVSSKLGPP